jgi:2,4'-dihydroxyacetophenone dioxygenase
MSTRATSSRQAPPARGAFDGIPESLHIASSDGVFARDFGFAGVSLQLLQADVEGGFFVVRIRFAPGTRLPRHQHTGAVHALTLSGEWSYLEYASAPPNRAGSYLYEPPGSVHTLKVADHLRRDTDVVFIVEGAMLILDDADHVTAVLDAASHAREWPLRLREQGMDVPKIIAGGRIGYAAPR